MRIFSRKPLYHVKVILLIGELKRISPLQHKHNLHFMSTQMCNTMSINKSVPRKQMVLSHTGDPGRFIISNRPITINPNRIVFIIFIIHNFLKNAGNSLITLLCGLPASFPLQARFSAITTASLRRQCLDLIDSTNFPYLDHKCRVHHLLLLS